MSIVVPASREHKPEFYRRAGDNCKIYKSISRSFISFEEAINWVRERDLRIVVKADGEDSTFSDPMKVDTTPPAPLTRDGAIISLNKKCISAEISVIIPPGEDSKYITLTQQKLEELGFE